MVLTDRIFSENEAPSTTEFTFLENSQSPRFESVKLLQSQKSSLQDVALKNG